MKTLRLILISTILVAASTLLVNAQNKRTVTGREAKSKVRIGETQPQPDEPQYRELRCRGGATLRFNTGAGRTNSSGEQTMIMMVKFQPAALPADAFGRNLQPGQCAFPERTVRADEPYDIIQEIVYFGQSRQASHGSTVDSSLTAAERFPDAQNVPKYLSNPKHYWSFYVRQNAPLPNGLFEASNGKHWKPAPPLRINDKIKIGQP